MSLFTVVIIIGAIYQLYTAVTKKKDMQQLTPGKRPDSLRTPDIRSIGDVIQGVSRGTWKEQLRQVLENGSYQAESLKSIEAKAIEETMDYVESEGTQGIEGTSDYVGILGAEAYKSTVEIPPEEMGMNSSGLRAFPLSLTQRGLVQGVMWAEILGKPRAMHPYRGPRT